jgi:cell division protein FtsB
MSHPTWLELLREQLVNPDEPISDGKHLALKDGGGITLDRRDSTIKLTGAACRNLDILEMVMLLHQEKPRGTVIIASRWQGIFVALHYRKRDEGLFFQLKKIDINDLCNLTASVADFYGIPHNLGSECKRKGWEYVRSYEDTRQRIRATLREKYDGYEPDRPPIKPAPPDWKKIGCLIFFAGVAICFTFLIKQCSRQQQIATKAINQKNLMRAQEILPQLIKDFRQELPQDFSQIIQRINYRSHNGSNANNIIYFTTDEVGQSCRKTDNKIEHRRSLQNNTFYTTRCRSLYTALVNIKIENEGGRDANAAGYLSSQQAVNAFLDEAKTP